MASFYVPLIAAKTDFVSNYVKRETGAQKKLDKMVESFNAIEQWEIDSVMIFARGGRGAAFCFGDFFGEKTGGKIRTEAPLPPALPLQAEMLSPLSGSAPLFLS